ncbi:MAG TPA: hypothetical protein VFL93_16555 [Longimicrobiaceae bacterium]|jgi:hypothetical protein|nr:hypothetical protein [Longimicrobiaceae bacterium]
MAYGVIQFVEEGAPRATLVRTENGHPTGPDGLMDPLSALIESVSPAILDEGSPGAARMAMLFFAREQEAGRGMRIVGAEGEWGITPREVDALPGRGYYYEVSVGRAGERAVPHVLASGIEASH